MSGFLPEMQLWAKCKPSDEASGVPSLADCQLFPWEPALDQQCRGQRTNPLCLQEATSQVTGSSERRWHPVGKRNEEKAGSPRPGAGRFRLPHGGKKANIYNGSKRGLGLFKPKSVTIFFIRFISTPKRTGQGSAPGGVGTHGLRSQGSRLTQGTQRARGPRRTQPTARRTSGTTKTSCSHLRTRSRLLIRHR